MELKLYPDKVLRTPCQSVREITDADLARMDEMLKLMYEKEGLGLAGPQVGWNRRVVTLDVEQQHSGERIFINPRIVASEGEVLAEEGCLSIPGVRAPVLRAEKVVVVAYTVRGERVEQEAEGLHARAWQHEIDHLNGVLFIDHLEPTTLLTLRQELRELEEAAKQKQRS